MLVFDVNNTGYIHKFLGHKVVNLKKDDFKVRDYDIIYFADNCLLSLNKVIEKAFRNSLIVNSPVIARWGYDRDYGFKVMKKIFENNSNVRILDYKVYKDINNIDWDKEEGVIKLLSSDAGYKTTYIFHSKEELLNAIESFKDEYKEGILIQELCKGEEVAFGTFFVNSEPVLPVYVSFEFKKSINNKVGGNTGQSAEFGFYSTHPIALSIVEDISNYLKKNNINYTGVIDINGGWEDNKFHPYEWTVSRDGYPEIACWLVNEDFMNVLKTKQWSNTKFKYCLVIRLDDISNERKIYEFKVNEEEIKANNFIWIPECKFDGEKYITKDAHIVGLLYKESNEVENIEINSSWFSMPIIYYTSFNEDIKKKWEFFKWIS